MPSPSSNSPWAPPSSPTIDQSLSREHRQPSFEGDVDPSQEYETAPLSTIVEALPDLAIEPRGSPSRTSPKPSSPIQIPEAPHLRNPRNQLDTQHTPLSARGDNKQGHFFPVRDSSPHRLSRSLLQQERQRPNFPIGTRQRAQTPLPRSPSASALYAGSRLAPMAGSHRYTPTSPLSPRTTSNPRPMSPSMNRTQPSARPMKIPLPKYHPMNHHQRDSPHAVPVSQINYPPDAAAHSTRFMREKQWELIDKAKMSSRIAASPYGPKPESPRLDPLGSPKGPMTPLALEEATDYFQVVASRSGLSFTQPENESESEPEDEGRGKGERTPGSDNQQIERQCSAMRDGDHSMAQEHDTGVQLSMSIPPEKS